MSLVDDFVLFAEPAEILLGDGKCVLVGRGASNDDEYAYLSVFDSAGNYVSALLDEEDVARVVEVLES